MYWIQHTCNVIKFITDLPQITCFLRVPRFPPLVNETDRHDITELLLKMALSTTTLTPNPTRLNKLVRRGFTLSPYTDMQYNGHPTSLHYCHVGFSLGIILSLFFFVFSRKY